MSLIPPPLQKKKIWPQQKGQRPSASDSCWVKQSENKNPTPASVQSVKIWGLGSLKRFRSDIALTPAVAELAYSKI